MSPVYRNNLSSLRVSVDSRSSPSTTQIYKRVYVFARVYLQLCTFVSMSTNELMRARRTVATSATKSGVYHESTLRHFAPKYLDLGTDTKSYQDSLGLSCHTPRSGLAHLKSTCRRQRGAPVVPYHGRVSRLHDRLQLCSVLKAARAARNHPSSSLQSSGSLLVDRQRSTSFSSLTNYR